MLSQCLVASITKKVSFYSLLLGKQLLIALKYKIFIKVFEYILNSLENF